MSKFLGAAVAGLTALSLGTSALAASPATHVRGTIESVSGNTLALKSYGGQTVDLTLGSGTKFASVVPSSLSKIKKGDFIGAAASGPENNMVAQEVVIFPNSMRGAGEGHYPWSLPAVVANADANGSSAGAALVNSTMTNGTVASTSAASSAPPVQGTMTNGTVTGTSAASNAPPVQGTMTNGTVANSSTKSGGKELTISFKGQKVQIAVPPSVPVVRFVPAKRSIVKPGAKAFVSASQPSGGSGALQANFVAVGKNGLMPPM